MKVAQQPQRPPDRSNQIWATTSDKKDTWATSEVTVKDSTYVATAAGSNIPICRYNIKGCYVHWFKLWSHVRKIHPSDLRGH